MKKPRRPTPPRPSTESEEPGAVAAVWTSVEQLRPWLRNPRVNQKTVPKLMALIERVGWGRPLVVRREDNEIIAGHTALEAALRLGKTTVPVRFVDLTEADAHLMALGDNRVAETSKWEPETLTEVLGGFSLEDIGIAGWDAKALEKLFETDEAEEVSVEELAVDVEDDFWISVRGPLGQQAEALEVLRARLEGIPGIVVEIGTTRVD